MKKVLITMMMLVLVVVLAACGTKDEKKPVTSGTSDKEPAVETEKVTVKHELDKNPVEITKNPETVVVFDFGILDTLDELGVEVAGLPQSNVPGYLSKYEDSKYKNLGSLKEPNFEEIHAMKPDVIFISGRQADLYDQFAEIAPTVFVGLDYSNYMESFKHNMELVAEIFGKEDDMSEELADIDAQIADIKEQASELDAKSLIVLGSEGKVSAYGPSSRFGIIHDVFGFAPADEKIEASTHGQNVTFEYILTTNPGILFVIDRDAAIGNDSSVKESIENDLVIKTDAYENDKMVYLDGEYWYLSGGGLLSMKEMIKEVEAAL